MPYRLLKDGSVEADTPEEILALQRAQSGKGAKQPSAPTASKGSGSWADFIKLLRSPSAEKQLKFLRALKSSARGLKRETAATKLEVANVQGMGGITGGITKNAIKAGLTVADVYSIEGNIYRAGPLLREHEI